MSGNFWWLGGLLFWAQLRPEGEQHLIGLLCDLCLRRRSTHICLRLTFMGPAARLGLHLPPQGWALGVSFTGLATPTLFVQRDSHVTQPIYSCCDLMNPMIYKEGQHGDHRPKEPVGPDVRIKSFIRVGNIASSGLLYSQKIIWHMPIFQVYVRGPFADHLWPLPWVYLDHVGC